MVRVKFFFEWIIEKGAWRRVQLGSDIFCVENGQVYRRNFCIIKVFIYQGKSKKFFVDFQVSEVLGGQSYQSKNRGRCLGKLMFINWDRNILIFLIIGVNQQVISCGQKGLRRIIMKVRRIKSKKDIKIKCINFIVLLFISQFCL